jgi:hypothetical protein
MDPWLAIAAAASTLVGMAVEAAAVGSVVGVAVVAAAVEEAAEEEEEAMVPRGTVHSARTRTIISARSATGAAYHGQEAYSAAAVATAASVMVCML